jgi:long-chain acyl-CoA synthetase
MRRETLIDFFDDFAGSTADFLVHDDGYRSRTFRYADVSRAARRLSRRLREAGLAQGDKVLVWGENRPEWIVALWACFLEGIVLVPIDYHASVEFLRRVAAIVDARLLIAGDEVATRDLPERIGGLAVWTLGEVEWPDAAADVTPVEPRPSVGPADTAEIIFTSGATAEPKGVVITHRNVLANIVPVEREVLRYRKYGRPFFPIRFLNLLPLSHMFGQAMATFIPPMLPGVVVFMRGYNPSEIVHQIRSRRVSVLVSVPKILDVLREYVRGRIAKVPPQADTGEDATKAHWLIRWWRYRAVHRAFGWKFWSFLVGAAPLDPELEAFWSRRGFLVVQGYGLTETAPIVTLNHPFHTRAGSVGKPIAGVDVRIAADGEILVRGGNVTSGYFNAPDATAEAFRDGWFHTGDIGGIDEQGQLFVRGRKKEMIVTPEGLNVFPEDVEQVLNAIPGVHESAAIGLTRDGQERVHAVLTLAPGIVAEDVVRQANARLADHQRIRGASVWPEAELPRTEGTRKLKRREIKARVESGARAETPARPAADSIQSVLRRFAPAREVAANASLEELGLSSLERVELLMALEQQLDTTIDEGAFASARTVEDLRRLVERPAGEPDRPLPEPLDFPRWNRAWWARAIRRASLPTWILPVARVFAWTRVEGLDRLPARGPVIFAANHQSHIDTPVILQALPAQWRYRVAPAMAKEFFHAYFFPEQHSRRERFLNGLNYHLAALFFNAFPLPQREAGTRQTLRYAGELIGAGFSILIFPEGRRTERGEIQPFRPGVAMMAARLGVPVVPVRLDGADRVLHQSWKMARPGRVRVAFGAPLNLNGEDYPAMARSIEEAVKAL